MGLNNSDQRSLAVDVGRIIVLYHAVQERHALVACPPEHRTSKLLLLDVNDELGRRIRGGVRCGSSIAMLDSHTRLQRRGRAVSLEPDGHKPGATGEAGIHDATLRCSVGDERDAEDASYKSILRDLDGCNHDVHEPCAMRSTVIRPVARMRRWKCGSCISALNAAR